MDLLRLFFSVGRWVKKGGKKNEKLWIGLWRGGFSFGCGEGEGESIHIVHEGLAADCPHLRGVVGGCT